MLPRHRGIAGALTVQVRPRHHILGPVDSLPLTVLQEIDDETADRIFRRLGQVDRVCYFLHGPVSVRHRSNHLRVECYDVSLERQFGGGSCFVLGELIRGHFLFYHANSFDATKLRLLTPPAPGRATAWRTTNVQYRLKTEVNGERLTQAKSLR